MTINPDLLRSEDQHHEAVDICRAALLITADARKLVERIADRIQAGSRYEARCAAVQRVVARLVREDATAPAPMIESDLSALLYGASRV